MQWKNKKNRLETRLGIHAIRLDGLRIEECLLLCDKRSFATSCTQSPKGVVKVLAPSIAIHTNEPFGNLERGKCASTRVDSPKP